MKIQILTIGKIREKGLAALEADYLKRLPKYLHVSFLELKGARTGDAAVDTEEEGKALLKRLYPDDVVVALSEDGTEYASHGFSTLLSKHLDTGTKRLVFILGGAGGLAKRVKQRADLLLSLSQLTFPHQLARIILVEQIYRASTLRDGIPYHK